MNLFSSLQLYMSRLKVAEDEEKSQMDQIIASYMSDEEDGQGNKKGSWVVRKPRWRSLALSNLLDALQGKVDECETSSSS